MKIGVEYDGNVFDGTVAPDSSNPDLKLAVVNTLGLWMAGRQNGIRASIGGNTAPWINRLEFERPVADGGGLYLVGRNDINTGVRNRPSDAPETSDGAPKLYGDRMVWGVS